jgi:hypothetical protein
MASGRTSRRSRRKVFSAMSRVFQITAVAFSTFLKRLAAAVRSRREGRLHWVGRPQMLPVLAWELVERHHPLPVAIKRAPDLGVAAFVYQA